MQVEKEATERMKYLTKQEGARARAQVAGLLFDQHKAKINLSSGSLVDFLVGRRGHSDQMASAFSI